MSLDIPCESSAKTIDMKYQDLFSLKNKKKKFFECRLLQILLGALRVNPDFKIENSHFRHKISLL